MPEFVDVILPVVYMGAPGRAESLSDSEDGSFDEESVGRSDKLFVEVEYEHERCNAHQLTLQNHSDAVPSRTCAELYEYKYEPEELEPDEQGFSPPAI